MVRFPTGVKVSKFIVKFLYQLFKKSIVEDGEFVDVPEGEVQVVWVGEARLLPQPDQASLLNKLFVI